MFNGVYSYAAVFGPKVDWEWLELLPTLEEDMPIKCSPIKPSDALQTEATAMVECARAIASLPEDSKRRVAEWLLRSVKGEPRE